jgi:hypothetical protein
MGRVSAIGLGLSWTGWTLILIAAGMIAGYVAELLKDSPIEEWTAKCIWGDATEKWVKQDGEQQELNQLLMGVSAEFEFSDNTLENVFSAGQFVDGGIPGAPLPTQTKQLRLRLEIPSPLREKLKWKAEVYMDKLYNRNVLIASAGTNHPATMTRSYFDNTSDAVVSETGSVTIISLNVDKKIYTYAYATLRIFDGLDGDELVVSKSMYSR